MVSRGAGRLLLGVLGLYLLLALVGRFVEGMGAARCGCAEDCWCRRPGLGFFRWVFPYGHKAPALPETGLEQ